MKPLKLFTLLTAMMFIPGISWAATTSNYYIVCPDGTIIYNGNCPAATQTTTTQTTTQPTATQPTTTQTSTQASSQPPAPAGAPIRKRANPEAIRVIAADNQRISMLQKQARDADFQLGMAAKKAMMYHDENRAQMMEKKRELAHAAYVRQIAQAVQQRDADQARFR